MTTATCAKCDGKGNIRGFGHIANGVCFTCNGSGRVTVKAHTSTGCAPKVTIAAELGEVYIPEIDATETAVIFSDGTFGLQPSGESYASQVGPLSMGGRAIARTFGVAL